MVQRYQPANGFVQPAGFEVWNEENTKGFWNVVTGPNAADYAQLFNRVEAQVQMVNPGVPVIVGGLARVAQDSSSAKTITTFLNAFYDAAGPNPLRPEDGVGVHPYPKASELTTLNDRFAQVMSEVRGVLAPRDPGRQHSVG